MMIIPNSIPKKKHKRKRKKYYIRPSKIGSKQIKKRRNDLTA
jgi:hypothetical protein